MCAKEFVLGLRVNRVEARNIVYLLLFYGPGFLDTDPTFHLNQQRWMQAKKK